MLFYTGTHKTSPESAGLSVSVRKIRAVCMSVCPRNLKSARNIKYACIVVAAMMRGSSWEPLD